MSVINNHIEKSIRKIIKNNKYEYVPIQPKNLHIIKDFIVNNKTISTNDPEILLYYGLITEIRCFVMVNNLGKKTIKKITYYKKSTKKKFDSYESTDTSDIDDDTIDWSCENFRLSKHKNEKEEIILFLPEYDSEDEDDSEIDEDENTQKVNYIFKMMKTYIINYYTESINSGYTTAMIFLGDFYNKLCITDMMEKYYKMGVDNGDCRAAYKLVVYYRESGDYENVMKYYKFIIDNIDCNKFNSLAEYYRVNNLVDLMKECLGFSISNKNSTAMFLMSNHYHNICDNDNMLKFLNMAIELDNRFALYKKGKYIELTDKKTAIEYYTKAAKQNHNSSILKLFNHYYRQNDEQLLLEYYLKAAIFCSSKIHKKFCKYMYKMYANDMKIRGKVDGASKAIIKKILIIGYNNNIQPLLNFCVINIMKQQLQLSKKYHNIIKNINFISPNYLITFNIYKITGKIYSESSIIQYYSNFMDLISMPQKSNALPRNIIIKIAGYLFE